MNLALLIHPRAGDRYYACSTGKQVEVTHVDHLTAMVTDGAWTWRTSIRSFHRDPDRRTGYALIDDTTSPT